VICSARSGAKFDDIIAALAQPFGSIERLTTARGARLEQFQEKWKPVFRPELRQNNALDRISDSMKR
jgi:hypothetical protein